MSYTEKDEEVCLLCQDEANRKGGKWIVRLRKAISPRCWENLVSDVEYVSSFFWWVDTDLGHAWRAVHCGQ